HKNPLKMVTALKKSLSLELEKLKNKPLDDLLEERYKKYRNYGSDF
ncbi:MAG: acetyl-CoA carboxylase carboxyltransferase subunit alpha, partial [Clostridium sp.]